MPGPLLLSDLAREKHEKPWKTSRLRASLQVSGEGLPLW